MLHIRQGKGDKDRYVPLPEATPSELPAKLHAKYAGLLDRVTLYAPFVPGENDERWRALAAGIHRVTDTNAPAF